MLTHYLKLTFRGLARDRGYALLNIAGLAIGTAAFILVLLFIRDDLAYDRSHPDADRLFRIAADVKIGEREIAAPMTPGPLGAALEQDYADVVASLRVFKTTRTVARGSDMWHEERFLYADPEFFQLFGFPLARGDAGGVLAAPRSLVLGADAARRYFGADDPTGRTLVVNGEPYTVTGIAAPAPRSHIRFDFVAPLSSLAAGPWIDTWLASNFYTYIKLAPGAEPADLEAAFPDFIARNIGPMLGRAMGTTFDRFLESGGRLRYGLQSVPRIHLHSDLEFELEPNGSITVVYVLLVLGTFILGLACINYVNLATARASRRSLEVGLRKTLGAEPGQLRGQFLLESTVVSALAVALAVLLVRLLLPHFNAVIGREIELRPLGEPALLAGAALLALAVGVLSGAYPAFLLASFRPITAVRRVAQRGAGAARFRDVLVGFQFTVAVALIVATIVVHRQIEQLLGKDLGFDPENVLVIERARVLGGQWAAVKQELSRVPGVQAVSAASSLPGWGMREIFLGEDGGAGEDMETAWLLDADPDLFRTIGIGVVAGRAFDEEDAAKRGVALINGVAASRLGHLDPIGIRLEIPARPKDPVVIGMFGDIHVESLHKPLRPTVIRPLSDAPGFIAVRHQPGQREQVADRIRSVWATFAPGEPLELTPMAGRIAGLYRGEQRALTLTNWLASIAILIACLGVLGLAALACAQRTREIAVRKVHGATAGSIVLLLSRGFIRLVLIAVVCATPIAALALNRWLDAFAYRIPIPWWAFPAAGALAITVAFIGVGHQALLAARTRPAESLRHE